MKCHEFRSWLEENGLKAPIQMPQVHVEHHESCPTCQSFLKEELFWQEFFAAAPQSSSSGSLWPGVVAKIQARLEGEASFTALFVSLSWRLAPAFVLLLLVLAAGTLWREPAAASPDSPRSIVALVEGSQEGWRLLEDDPMMGPWLEGWQG